MTVNLGQWPLIMLSPFIRAAVNAPRCVIFGNGLKKTCPKRKKSSANKRSDRRLNSVWRSEERRVGKEYRERWGARQHQKRQKNVERRRSNGAGNVDWNKA